MLLAWENEAFLAVKDLGPDKFEIVVPSISILAEPPVAVVDKVAAKHGTTGGGRSLLKYLYSPRGQQMAAKHFYRPADAAKRCRPSSASSSRNSNCSRSTRSSAAGGKPRPSISTMVVYLTRSTNPGSRPRTAERIAGTPPCDWPSNNRACCPASA